MSTTAVENLIISSIHGAFIKRSTVVTEIVGDTALQGIAVSDDTVRRYLNEARECLREWRESSR